MRRWERRLGVAPFVLLAAVLVPPPAGDGTSLLGLPNLCGFRYLTGIPCPACGLTRSLVCCGHLRLAEALQLNPVGPLVFVLLLAAALLRWSGRERRLPPYTYERAALVVIALLLGAWALRLTGILPAPP